jgi:hypothetical protein
MALMKTEYYWIEGPWKGRLAIVPRPRGGDWLEDEIHSWHEAGLDTVVSLLTTHEIEEFDLGSEERLSKAQGIEFISFPILDREVPRRANRLSPWPINLRLLLRQARVLACIADKASAGHLS